jgi:NitT/TauT family transport system substrate-binding protein
MLIRIRQDRAAPTRAARRAMLLRMALALGAGSGLPGFSTPAQAAGTPVRLSSSGIGSAGSVWQPLFDQGKVASKGLDISWIGGDPGQVQTQLLAGAVDVSAFGALGASEVNGRGGDITIFGPLLHNHGRWIVHEGSPYKSPKDLRGKKIATLPPASDTFRHAQMAAALQGLDLRNDFQVVHGPPVGNLALFSRRDVEAVITIEPTATRLVASGAREIARVGDMWKEATGDTAPLLLNGLGARRGWVSANRATAAAVVKLYTSLNAELRERPQLLAQFHSAMGIPAGETAAIQLLPKRLAEAYATQWDDKVTAGLDRQIEVAVKLGILARKPERSVYEAPVRAG